MRIFFLSETTTSLFINGTYFGACDRFERSAELKLEDELLLTFAPTDGKLPRHFCLNEQTLFSPPQGLTVYRSGAEIALFAHDFLPADQTLNVLFQTRVAGTLFTLCEQGTLQLNMENETGFHLLKLPALLKESSVRAWQAYFLVESESAFALLSRDGNILLSSEGKILSAEDTLKAEVPFHDCLGHTALCEWQGETLLSCTVESKREPTEATLALALFQSALIGADCTPFLHESLIEKAGALKEFLGDYTSVVLTDEPTRVGLVFPVRERVFEVKYYSVTVTDGKISNLSPEEAS